MPISAVLRAALAVAFSYVALGHSSPVEAAQRTFVSTSGNDANACSLVSPCRGFAKAITVTDTGGEIVVLDSGGYGTVAITKSVSIAAPAGVYAGVSVISGDGITINGSGINVFLRGLTINGQGGYNGVTIYNAATVRIEGSVIENFTGSGIYHTAGTLSVEDTTVRNNASIGVWSVGTVQATLNRTRLEENLDGVRAQNGAQVAVQQCVISHNAHVGAFAFLNDDTVTRRTRMTVSRSLMSFNEQGVQVRSIVHYSGGVWELFAEADVTDSTVNDSSAEGLLATQLNGGLAILSASRNTITDTVVGGPILSVHITDGTDGTVAGNCLLGSAAVDSGGVIRTFGNNMCSGTVGGGGTIFSRTTY